MAGIKLMAILILVSQLMVYGQDDDYVHISNEIDEDDEPGEPVPPEKDPPIEEVEISLEDAACLKKKLECADDNDNIISKRSRYQCTDSGFKHPNELSGSERLFRITPNKPGVPDLKVCRALMRTEKYGKYFIMGQAWMENGEWKCGVPYGGVMNTIKPGGYFEILTGTGYELLHMISGAAMPAKALAAGVQVENTKTVVNWPGLLAIKHTKYLGGEMEYFVGRIPIEDDAYYIYYMTKGSETYKRRPFFVVACR